MPHQAQPVPPIYQPEVAAEAIVYASKSRRRAIYVGLPTVIAIVGNKLFPGLGDLYLGKTGIKSQQTAEPSDRGRPDNLYEPVSGDYGAHGRFDDRAHSFSIQLWADIHRGWLAAVGVTVLLTGLGVLLARREKP